MIRTTYIMATMEIVLFIFISVVVDNTYANSHGLSGSLANKVQIEELTIEQVGERADGLIRKLRIQVDAEDRYANMLKDASEEDRLVLDNQLASVQRDSIYDVLKLADLLLKMEQKVPQPELRKQVEDLIRHILPRLQLGIDRLRNEIDRSRALRSEAKSDQQYAIEIKVATYTDRVNEGFDELSRILLKMEQLGMDTEQVKTAIINSFFDRANELSGRITLTLSRIDELKFQQREFPDDVDISKLMTALKKNLTTNTKSLEKSLSLMEKLGIATDDFRDDLVAATRDFSSGLRNTGTGIKMAVRSLKDFGHWLFENSPKLILKVLVFLGVFLFFRLIARILSSGITRALERSKLNYSQLARKMIVSTSSNLVTFFGLLVALSQFGFSLGPLLAGLGVAGFIVGFALQDTLGNFASGVMILLYQPYDVGDLIEAGGVFGKVHDMSLVSTNLRTLDNQLIVIPNNKIWGDVIKNVTAQKRRRVDMVFGISYTDDIPKAEKILEDILKSNERVLIEPEPIVRLHKLGDSSVDFIVRPWVKSDDYWDVYWDVTRTVKLRFDEAGVSIPFPQQDVHVYHENRPNADANQLPTADNVA